MMEIRTLGPDEKITENGFYAIPLSRHHDQPCNGPSVTSGVLRTMELETPADVWAFSKLNPNRWEKPETDALRMGVAMALFVEGGPERVLEGFSIHPEDKPRKPTAAQIAAYDEGRGTEAGIASVEYWRAVEANPDDYLTKTEFETICTMGAVLAADPAAQAVLGGIPEVTMAVYDDETGLWKLARPDVVAFDGTVTDYKKMAVTTKPFTYRMVDGRITDHGYDMQLAFAAECFEALTGEWPMQAGIVAQSGKAPHHVIIRPFGQEDLRIGQWRNRRALRRFQECLASGNWPGPGADIGEYQRPEWQRLMLLEQMNIEGVAP